jgi:hypothetical protein
MLISIKWSRINYPAGQEDKTKKLYSTYTYCLLSSPKNTHKEAFQALYRLKTFKLSHHPGHQLKKMNALSQNLSPDPANPSVHLSREELPPQIAITPEHFTFKSDIN